jgi:leucyl aminopeptidase
VPGLPDGRRPGDGLPVVELAGELPPGVTALALTTGAGALHPPVPDGVPDLVALLAREDGKGDAGELIAVQGSVFTQLWLLGLGDGSPSAARKAGAAVARRARSVGVLVVDLRGSGLSAAAARGFVEGALLASYGFSLGDRTPRELHRIVLVTTDAKTLRPGVDAGATIAHATAAARDLVNTPPMAKSPAWLADRAVELLTGLDVRVRDEHDLAAEGFGGILAVGQGSTRPPRLVEASYGARRRGPHVVLIGKGITFDTGGLSLKRGDGMVTMKMDMGGAAAVFGALRAVADLGLPVRVTALAAIAENSFSGEAQRPGDVITHYGGRTVEVLNTDAEGRLVLADALAYADRVLDADVIVDVATLTGAMPVALGKKTTGAFVSDDGLARELAEASLASGERLWRMPLVEDYRAAIDSSIADLRNMGDPRLKLQGGSITAALFLREFTGGRPWAHLDIAGPAWSGGEDDELTKGGTGWGVRLLTTWLEGLARR